MSPSPKKNLSLFISPSPKFLALALMALPVLSSNSGMAQVQKLKLGEGRVLTYEQRVVDGAPATLVFLPGINRGLSFESETEFFTAPVLDKYNILSLTTSLHPQSIGALPETTPFYLMNGIVNSPSSRDLAGEVEAVIKKLKIQNPIAVSLSYSSSILASLESSKFLGLIEMVPMTDPLDGDDAFKRIARDQQDLAAAINPWLAPGIRYQRDAAYRYTWSNQVDSILSTHPEQYGKAPRVDDIKEGYYYLARAAEDYRLSKVDLPVPRHFILAEKEVPFRLENQTKAAAAENQKFPGQSCFVMVADSGHILPSENPSSAAVAVDKVAQALLKGRVVKGRVQAKKFTKFTDEELKQKGF